MRRLLLPRAHSFTLKTKAGVRYVLQARTAEEKEEWLSAIKSRISVLQDPGVLALVSVHRVHHVHVCVCVACRWLRSRARLLLLLCSLCAQ